jgi:hypothetical protein
MRAAYDLRTGSAIGCGCSVGAKLIWLRIYTGDGHGMGMVRLLVCMDAIRIYCISRRGRLYTVKLSRIPRVMLLSQLDWDRCGGCVVVH